LRDADTALYRAKAQGKARFEVFDAAMRAEAVARLDVETAVRQGLERQDFQPYYQPILELRTRRLVGFEALVRWSHPQRGLVSPDLFVGVAEETGLIVPIGWSVLDQACRQMSAWQARFPSDPPLHMCVNLSSRQFLQQDLVRRIACLLDDTGLPPPALKLEITESAIMDDPKSAAAMLAQLRSLGIRVSIDDFGTGYSSLSYLHRFPIDTLKIDRSFVNRMDVAEENTEIVRAIVTLAHNLDMDVVAEGVETPAQLERLQSLACEFGQGYLFFRPMDGAAATSMFKAGWRQ
jgi:EAL domain-containing protein (putative c-di-GMP-specific phosphodiesterase class I)